jgi:hypothetical protein
MRLHPDWDHGLIEHVGPLKKPPDGELGLTSDTIDDVERNAAMGATQPFGDGARPQRQIAGNAGLTGALAFGLELGADGIGDDGEGFEEQVFG